MNTPLRDQQSQQAAADADWSTQLTPELQAYLHDKHVGPPPSAQPAPITVMKMAKASEADLNMAMDLCGALDVLGQRFVPCMPEAIELLDADSEREPFDCDDDAQCGRALRHLLEIAERGSLSRVIWGMAVLLDPANRIVDPNADTLEHHPDVVAGLAAIPSPAPKGNHA